MKTKYLIKFLNNAAHLDVDLEFVDVLKTAVSEGKLHPTVSEHIFDNVDKIKHAKLASRVNTQHSRVLTINHLKSSIRASFITSLYEATSIYFLEILKATTKKGINKEQILGEHPRTFTSREIIEIGNYNGLLENIATSIFRQLENERSTQGLIEKMAKKLGLTIDKKIISEALPYFEIRHKLVHAEGKADKEFCSRFPNIPAQAGKNIYLSYKIVSAARAKTEKLIKEFDKQIVTKQMVSNSDLQP